MAESNKNRDETDARLEVLDALVDHLLELSRDRPETIALRRRLEGLRDNSGDDAERDRAERMLRRLEP
jgi:hypothetical protein